MWQYVNMTPSINPVLIDNQTVYYNFSAWLGGYSSQGDNAVAALTFVNQFNVQVGTTVTLGPVLPVDRNYTTSLLLRQTNGVVPVGARSCQIMVTLTVASGPTNDGDIDNIELDFSH